MKKIITLIFYSAIIIGGSVFIVRSFLRSAPQQQIAVPPNLTTAPARVYGKIEPAGREIFVSSPLTRKVVRIYVKEGDKLKKGQKLLSLENDVEVAELNVATAKVDSFRKALAISQDVLRRRENLFNKNADTEYVYTQAKLKVDLDASSLALAQKEADLAQAQIEQLELRSPIDGILYKFDVRLGETINSGDNSKVILGSEDLWVRLAVEAFWMNRVKVGDRYKVYSTETHELIGSGEVITKAPYLGRRDFRTEDDQERFDTKYMDVILNLKKDTENIPLGLSVVAEILPPSPPQKTP
jgi:multidrug efflux pump subunit AcrA (membrane-fusion protein)